MCGSPSFFLFGISPSPFFLFVSLSLSLSLSLSGTGEMQTLQRLVFPLVFLPRGHTRAPLPVPRRRLLHQGIAPAPVFFPSVGFLVVFFKERQIRPNRTPHTSPLHVFFGLFVFPLLLPPVLAVRPFSSCIFLGCVFWPCAFSGFSRNIVGLEFARLL